MRTLRGRRTGSTSQSSRRLVRHFATATMVFMAVVALMHWLPTTPAPHPSRTSSELAVADLTSNAGASAEPRPQVKAMLGPQMQQAGADASWWQAVSAQLERQEYAVTPAPPGLEASNRAHNLHATFGERGLDVVPRSGEGASPAWRFAWQTRGFGRPDRMQDVGPAAPELAGARVLYRRDGWSEWYENTAQGLEQGFTLEHRPEGDGPLQITGMFPGAFRPHARTDGAIDFIDGQGACAIRYGELHTWDAKGVELPSQITVAGEELGIVVDDRGAAYPLTIDPLLTSPAWIVEGGELYASLGVRVATAGDVNGDGYDDVIVGVAWHDGQAGWAFVYHGSTAGLSTIPAWTQQGDQVDTSFGLAVGTAGDVNGDGYDDVIIGAATYDNGQTNEGRAYVYHGSAAGLALTPAWTTESDQAGAEFGYSVATAGDVNGDGYDDVIVGAHLYDNGQPNEGRTFVYHGSAASLATTPAWNAECDVQGSDFGWSVAGAGDVNGDGYDDVIIGAYRYSSPEGWEGGAFVYHGSAAGLALTPVWHWEGNQIGCEFGNSVASAGDVNGDGYDDVIIGAHQYDFDQNNEGRAFVFLGRPWGPDLYPAWTKMVGQGAFGRSVSPAGDVDNDGFADVIVGAPSFANGEAGEGRAFVYYGSAAGLAGDPGWTAEANQLAASFGYSVATAGDVNGDGFSDVIVGAPDYSNGQEAEGRAFVYHGMVDPVCFSALPYYPGGLATGDFDNDGILDLVAILDVQLPNEGWTAVLRGGGTGGIGDGSFSLWDGLITSSLGREAVVADFDLDGLQDVALSHSDTTTGSVSVFLNTGAGFQPPSTIPLVGRTDGLAVADMDQDGILDFVVCLTDSAGNPNRGGVQVLRGGGLNGVWDGTFAVGPKYPSSGSLTNASARRVLIRDFNQDGVPDVMFSGTPSHCLLRFTAGLNLVCRECIGAGGNGIATGDFNEDGRLDFALSVLRELVVYLKSEVTDPHCFDVWFPTPPESLLYQLPSTPRDIAALDWNQDGILDIAATFDSLQLLQIFPGRGAAGVGDGTFGLPITLANGIYHGLAVGDFVTNGSPDFALSVPADDAVCVIPQTTLPGLGTGLAVLAPNGGEVWTQATAPPPAWGKGSAPVEVELAVAGRSLLAACSDELPQGGAPRITALQQVTWTKGAGVQGVDVAITRDDGVSWQTIATDHPGTSMTWIVTPPGTPRARVRVYDTAVAQRADQSDAVFTVPGTATDVAPDVGTERIATFTLRDANPVRGLAHFSMSLPVATDIQVDVFDVAGRLVRTLVRGRLEAGSHPVVWDRHDAGGTVAPRGVYFVRARADSFSTHRKLVLL